MHDAFTIAGRVASDAFWDDDTPAALVACGVGNVDVSGTPPHHLLFATSGSGGVPKWIAIGKPALAASATAVNAHLDVDGAAVWGLALPVHHVGGFGVVARARAAGCCMEIFDGKWNPQGVTAWLAGCGVTHTSLVPTQVHDLVRAGCRAPGGLVALVVGGGRLDVATGRAARALGWPVLASYGMTEAASQIATQPLAALDAPYQPSPMPVLAHWQVRADGAGCLEIAGPALFSGTVAGGVYRPRDGDWHATRDRVSVMPTGLVPRGRADAWVKVAGELIDPGAVEARLAAAVAPHGNALAVAAVPDARLGRRLVVVAEFCVPTALLDEAIGGYNATAPRSQRLGQAVRVAELPRSGLGKIQHGRLRGLAESGGEAS